MTECKHQVELFRIDNNKQRGYVKVCSKCGLVIKTADWEKYSYNNHAVLTNRGYTISQSSEELISQMYKYNGNPYELELWYKIPTEKQYRASNGRVEYIKMDYSTDKDIKDAIKRLFKPLN